MFKSMFQSKYSKILCMIIGSLLCTEVLAATIFSVAPTDRSQIYLGMILGGNVGSIQLSGDANTTLSLMFARFNYIILTIGVLVISYIGVSSTINTAREGEALGKKMSAWVPLRALLGTLLMVPGPTSGYSVVQITVVWIVLNGIGAANSIWSVILNQLTNNISAVANSSAVITSGASTSGNAALDSSLENLTQSVMMASTCMHALNNMTELSQTPGNMQQFGPVKIFVVSTPIQPSSTALTTLSATATVYVGLNTPSSNSLSSVCGYFTVKSTLKQCQNGATTGCNPNDSFNYATLSQRLAIKVAALQSMFSVIDPAATLIAQTTLAPNGTLDGRFYTPPNPGYVLLAQQAYLSQTLQLAQGIQVAPNAATAQSWEEGLNNSTSSTINYGASNLSGLPAAQSYGWIHAGSYYYSLVKSSAQSTNPDYQDIPTPNNVPTATTLDTNNNPSGGWFVLPSGTTNVFNNFISGKSPYFETVKLNNYLTAMNQYYQIDVNNSLLSTSNTVQMGGNSSTGNPIVDSVINYTIRRLQNAVVYAFENVVAGNGQDPLASLHQFGFGLMVSAEALALFSITLCMALSMGLSMGSCMSPVAWGVQTGILQLTPLIFGLAAMVWTGGATLNIYLPMVPYLIFSTAAFGWMIAVVEAVVGAPIVALALAHPSGDELGKLEQPLILLANVFLRPMLMLFGFVLGAGLLRAGIAFIDFGFLPAINSASTPTLFSIVAVLMMYVMLIMAIVNKSFSLIYLLPNQIMRWIGGPTETSDPSDMVRDAKGGFDTGAKAGQGALNESFNQAKAGISKHHEALGKKRDAKKAGAGKDSGGSSVKAKGGDGVGGGNAPGSGGGGGGTGGGSMPNPPPAP